MWYFHHLKMKGSMQFFKYYWSLNNYKWMKKKNTVCALVIIIFNLIILALKEEKSKVTTDYVLFVNQRRTLINFTAGNGDLIDLLSFTYTWVFVNFSFVVCCCSSWESWALRICGKCCTWSRFLYEITVESMTHSQGLYPK